MNLRATSVALLAFAFVCQTSFSQQSSDGLTKHFKAREVGPSATGGRIVDIAVNPNNPYHIFAAAASGGLFETKNNGTTWNPIFQNEGTISIGDIALDPNDVKTIWVGTGEANNQRSSLFGDGVYKTTDGGKSWTNTGLKETHHIGRIVVDPQNTDTVYVAALGHLYTTNEERGLFKTTDGGKTWKKVLYVDDKTGAVDVVMDPKNTKTLYVATYQRMRRAWHFEGAGEGSAIYKTTDGGKSWTKLSGGLPTGNIGRIGLAIYPKNPNIVYASVSNQNPATSSSSRRPTRNSFGSTTSPGAASEWNPIFYHEESRDSGASTTETRTPSADEIETPFGFSLETKEKQLVVTGVSRRSAVYGRGLRNGAIVKSLGGISAKHPKKIAELVKGMKTGDRALLIVEIQGETKNIPLQIRQRQTRPRRPRAIGGEVYKTTDGGKSWKRVNRRAAGGSPAYYYGQIRVDPNNEKRLFMLSVPVYVSTDGGVNWRTDGARSVHVDHHALWINPKNSYHMLLGNDGGFHATYDGGKTWDHVFNISLAQFYAIGVDMQKPYHVYGGLQDNGSWGGPSRASFGGVGKFDWYRVGGGDGFYVQPDPTDHNIVFGESQFGMIYRLDKRQGRSQFIRPPASSPTVRDRYNWNSPIMLSHHNPRVVYFAGNKVFKSIDRGRSWEVISPDLTSADPAKIAGNVPHCTITTLDESSLDRNILMAGCDDGKFHWTNDGGKTWIDMTDRIPYRPENWWCSRVELSSHDKAVAYVTFTGYREDDFRPFVFKTSDAGKTWQSISNGLPNESVNVIKEDRNNKNLLFVGTEMAVYASIDGGKSWFNFSSGMPRVSVQDMVIHPRDNDLVLGTHGRGIFIVDNITPLQQLNDDIKKNDVHLFKPRTEFVYGLSLRRGSISGNRKWVAANPSRGVRIWYYVNKANADFTINIYNEMGDRVTRVQTRNKNPGLQFATVGLSSVRSVRRRPSSPSSLLRPGKYVVELKIGDKKQRVPLVIERAE